MSTDGSYSKRGANLPVVSSVRYASGPPARLHGTNKTDDGDVIETKKQEEWITSKKVETKKNRQIETRVKRQVVLEDGQVVEDTGPQVSTNTTEDVTTNEKENTEHRKLGDDPPVGEGWVAIPGAVIVSEKKERTTNTKEERHDEFETEQVEHLGDIDHSQLVRAIKEKGDLRLALVKKGRTWSEPSDASELASRPRVIHQSSKHKKVVDTEEVDEHSEIKDGKITTETKKTLYREEFNNEESPDDGEFSDQEQTKETSHNFTHTKDENLVEYVAVPEGGTLAQGKKIGEGMHYVSENIEEEREGGEGQEADGILVPSSLGHRWRNIGVTPPTPAKPYVRSDALTSRPLDLEQEDETRKLETSKWLESHFGSEDSYRSSEDERNARRPSASKGDRKGPNMTVVKVSSPIQSATPSPTPVLVTRKTDSLPRRTTVNGHVGAPPPPPPPPPKPNRSAHFQGVREWNETEDRKVYRTEADVRMNGTPMDSGQIAASKNDQGGDLYALPDRRAKMSKFIDGTDSTPVTNPTWKRSSATPVKQSPLRQEYDRIARQVKADEEQEVSNYRRPNGPTWGDTNTLTRPGRATIGSSATHRSVSKSTDNLYSENSLRRPILTKKMTSTSATMTSTGTSPPRRGPPQVADISYSTAPPPQKPERKKKKSVKHLHDTLTSTGSSPMEADRRDDRVASSRSKAEAASGSAATPSSKHGDLRSVTYTFQSPADQYSKAPSHAQTGPPVQKPARQSSPAKRQAKSESFRHQHQASGAEVIQHSSSSGLNQAHQPLKEVRSDPDQQAMRWPFHKSDNGTQTMPKSLSSSAASAKYRHGQPDGAAKPRIQQYYLGEDPYKASLFSPQMQDRQYPNVRNVRKEVRMLRKSNGPPSSNSLRTVTTTNTIINSNSGGSRRGVAAENIPSSSATLDRNWKTKAPAVEVPLTSSNVYKSEQSQHHSSYMDSSTNRSQTLPRKPNNLAPNLAGSMFNISIVNNVADEQPPQRPTRPERLMNSSKVNRSQSFNVAGFTRPTAPHGLKYTNSTRIDITGYSPLARKSTSSSLQRLNDAAEPLKSPDVLKIVRTASLRRGLDSVDGGDSTDDYSGRYGSGNLMNGLGARSPLYNTFSSPMSANDTPMRSSTLTKRTTLTSQQAAGRGHSPLSPQTSGDSAGDDPKKQKFLKGLLNTAPELFKHLHGEEPAGTSGAKSATNSEASSPRDRLMSTISGLGTSVRPSEIRKSSTRMPLSSHLSDDGKSTPTLLERIKSPTPPKSNESFARITSPAPSSRVSETVEISRSPEGYRTVTKSIVQRTIVPSTEERFTKDPDRPKYSDSLKPATKRQPQGVFIEVRDWNSR